LKTQTYKGMTLRRKRRRRVYKFKFLVVCTW